MHRDTVVPNAPEAPASPFVRATTGTFRPWQSAEESRQFARAFSKALVESLVRGEASVGVWIDGHMVWQTSRR